MEIPKVFISYSHDSIEHKKMILSLAIRLRNNGIDLISDQFELKPGDDMPNFMEKHLSDCNKILMICTENYVLKVNKGTGGVGYEKMIITSQLMRNIDENKIIPNNTPIRDFKRTSFLKTKLYINFYDDEDFEFSYDELVRTIHNSPLFCQTSFWNNPFKQIEKINQEGNISIIDDIMKFVIDDYSSVSNPYGRYVDTSFIMSELKISRIMTEATIDKVVSLGLVEWRIGKERIVITEKRKTLGS